MSFSIFLKKHIESSDFTRNELLAKINLFNKEFENLDSVTLSRWVNNKTTPSLYKQIILCLFFESDLISFIKNKEYTLSNSALSLRKKHESNFINKDSELHYLYNKYNNISYHIKKNNTIEYRKKFSLFYTNFDLYRDIFEYVDEKKLNLTTFSFEEKINNTITSHDSIVMIDNTISKHIKHFFSLDMDLTNYLLANSGYHRNIQAFENLFALSVYFIIATKQYDFISIIRGRNNFLTVKELGYEQISPCYIEDEHIFYLCKANILKVISNALVISKLSDFYNKNQIEFEEFNI
ncbi:hypothetical protein ACRTC3_19960 [Photobacterium damselae]|uniref:hypothetical protein n=1 Tax=Photobacterium damselae TaxID=38293 RepID=UPI003D7C9C79